MADEFLQAFQIGASLYDRAQTQKRMMDQLQLQTAQQLMQQKSADLQNKIHENAFPPRGEGKNGAQAEINLSLRPLHFTAK